MAPRTGTPPVHRGAGVPVPIYRHPAPAPPQKPAPSTGTPPREPTLGGAPTYVSPLTVGFLFCPVRRRSRSPEGAEAEAGGLSERARVLWDEVECLPKSRNPSQKPPSISTNTSPLLPLADFSGDIEEAEASPAVAPLADFTKQWDEAE